MQITIEVKRPKIVLNITVAETIDADASHRMKMLARAAAASAAAARHR